MKKIFILATAAIVAFASCMKSEVVYNQEPQEIAFRQFTGSMTKADPGTTALPDGIHMGVFAYIGSTEYFKNAEFKKQETGSKWAGASQSYYWPLKDKLDFTVYAPYQNTAVYAVDAKKLSVSIADNSSDQIDYLYGKVLYKDTPKPATPSEGVAVVLKHALSKVTINVKANNAGIFTVSSIHLNDTYQDGSYTVTYTSDGTDHTSAVEKGSTQTDIQYVDGTWTIGTEVGTNTNSKLVVPSDQTSITIVYKMKGSSADLTATIDLLAGGSATWDTGKHYTYNITLTAEEILFAPTVEDWNITDTTVNKDIK